MYNFIYASKMLTFRINVAITIYFAMINGYVIESKDLSNNIVCYYAIETQSVDRLQPEGIDASLCTHLILGFATVLDNALVPADPNSPQAYKAAVKLKDTNPSLKVLLAAGGGGSAAEFPKMVKTQQSRAEFINQSIPFLRQYGFDGFDVDWEFPGWGDDPKEDRELLSSFAQEFRAAIDSEIISSSENKLLFTLDVAQVPPIIEISYDIKELAKYVDYVNIMCYGYHFFTWYDFLTGHNSPLFRRHNEILMLANLNTAWSSNFWANSGMAKSKINVGVPTYGNTYTLMKENWNGLYNPTTGNGMFGGTITYPLVCAFLKNGGIEVFDSESQSYYAYQDKDWTSYDNEASVAVKAKWVADNGFAGVMTFDLNCDDWASTCNSSAPPFPLHRAIRDVFQIDRSDDSSLNSI